MKDNTERKYKTVEIQALYRGNPTKYFCVDAGEVDSGNRRWLVEKMEEGGNLRVEDWSAPASVREFDSFLATMRFDTQIEDAGMTLGEAAGM